MITSVELDEELFNEAWALSGLKTKKAMFHEVLRVYVGLHQQAKVKELRGKLVWEDDLATLRGGRRANRR
jgi:Arc/MetJ family transcription regulator